MQKRHSRNPDNAGLLRLFDEQTLLFNELVKAAGLDPHSDFRNRDLRAMYFARADLDGFDFTHSDLRGTSIREASHLGTASFQHAQLDPADKVWLQTTLGSEAADAFFAESLTSQGDIPPEDRIQELSESLIREGAAVPVHWGPYITRLNLADPSRRTDNKQKRQDDRGVTEIDLSLLNNLTQLKTLSLTNTQVTNLLTLKNLTTLQALGLSGTQVSDVNALSTLIALRELYLRDTSVSNVAPLSALTALQKLDLAGTKVIDLKPLYHLIELRELNLRGTRVHDLKPLAPLKKLQRLDLYRAEISDFSPLAHLTDLRALRISGLKARQVARVLRHIPMLRINNYTASELEDASTLLVDGRTGRQR